MNNENVTIMDYINEHWGWIVFVIGAIAKFAQDHLRINRLEEEVKDLNKGVEDIKQQNSKSNESLVRIAASVEAMSDMQKRILDKLDTYDNNINEFYKKYDLKEKS
jgi:archaellum component FlaC